jgi:cellulose synthase (UDP-forming)
MLGRHTYRSSDRIEAEESVIVHGNKSDYKAQTVNISDSGLALYITDPFYIEDNQQVSLTVSTKRYKASLVGSLVYVRQDGKGWRYAFSVKPKDNQSKRQYLQIVHDQPHSLPEQMNLWDTAYDDMVRNIQKRLAKQHYQRRRYPRLSINHILKFTDGTTCTLIDFNYRYLAVKDLKIRASLNYTYLTKNGVRLDLKVVIHAPARAGRTLLKVENLTSLEKNGFLDEVTQDLCGGR